MFLITSAKVDVPLLASLALATSIENEFSTIIVARETVVGSESNSLFTLCKPFIKAGNTTSVVNCPSPAILRSSPVVLPNPSPIACNTRGACSEMELNSCPRNTPDSNAWRNWNMAALNDCVLAPDTIAALPKPSVKKIKSF